MVTRFSGHLSDTVTSGDIFLALAIGTRFDSFVSGYVVLPCLIFSIISGIVGIDRICNGLRRTVAVVFLSLSSLLFVVNYLFFIEYKDNFNQWIFGVIYDDFGAVVKTTWAEYPLFTLSAVAFLTIAVIIYVSLKFLRDPWLGEEFVTEKFKNTAVKVLSTAFLLVLFVFAIRGSVGKRPVALRDAGITPDVFLNKLVLNPYSALVYAIEHYHKLSTAKGIREYLPDGDIEKAAQLFFNKNESLPDLDAYMTRRAKGYNGLPPRHVFLIVMESFSSWPLLKKYESFDLLPNCKQLGKKGILVKAFLPAASGTMTSLAALVTGLPEVGVFTNYQESARRPFPTSIAVQFKKLGYQTNLFYGGYLTWQRIGDFCGAQGFDNVYGGGNMGAWSNNEWGVDDGVLFEFILKTLRSDNPSFNLILSTSNHPPYDLPVHELGFSYEQIPKNLRTEYDGDVPLKVFGHLWYSDKVIGEFVYEIEQTLPCPVFAITGDHWSRKFLNSKPSLYERSSVPLLLYGKEVIKSPTSFERLAGSHLDIMPTLIELSAPQGFEYFSVGSNLLDFDGQRIGLGVKKIITPDFVMDKTGKIELLPFAQSGAVALDIEKMKTLLNAYCGVGWWRIMKGASPKGSRKNNFTF
ncbi:MAG: sulfatase-like hydrolase/transferase [Desulfobacterales bacterium]|nr:sulfatase-like hydrolase/transferase [Desulfobacterales bacterium]